MNKRFFALLGIFTLTRVISFYFQPGSLVNTAIAATLGALVVYLLVKKDILAWYIIAGEFILGGAGSYFHAGLSLRTIFLVTAIVVYTAQNFRDILSDRKKIIPIAALFTAGLIGAFEGLYRHNLRSNIISDLIPYFFVWYYFPLSKLLKEQKFVDFCKYALFSAVVGEAIFIAFTFFGYSTHLFVLQDAYYHWFRDIAGGKITLVQYDFYRLVLNEHLLLVPTLLYFIDRSVALKDHFANIASALLLFVLSINLTRIYLVGLFVGCIVMILIRHSKRAFAYSAYAAFIFLLMFSSLYLFASGGKSFGLEVFGLRLQSIIMPNIEDSSLSRILILPRALELIKTHPLLGSGLGTTVTVYSPIFRTSITTPNFDWGYLEILAEVGAVGAMLWALFVFKVFNNIKKLPSWQLSAFISFLVINITSPALFHVLGVTFLAYLLAIPGGASAPPASAPLRN